MTKIVFTCPLAALYGQISCKFTASEIIHTVIVGIVVRAVGGADVLMSWTAEVEAFLILSHPAVNARQGDDKAHQKPLVTHE